MNFEDQLAQCLSSYAMDDLYIIGGIPPEKLSNAIQNFPIDARDTVLALIDSTLTGSCKKGMAFGLRGAYWKNDWTTKTQRTFMRWDELSAIDHMIGSKTFDITLGPGNLCNLSGSHVKPAQAANLLRQLISVYNDFNASEQQSQALIQVAPMVTITAESASHIQLSTPIPGIAKDRYAQGVSKAFAIIVCAEGELDDSQVDLAIQFLEADDDISNKASAIEAMTSLVEDLLSEYAKSRPLFKLKCSKMIAQIRDEIVGPPREHVRLMLSELVGQIKTLDNSIKKNDVGAKLLAALDG